MNSLELLASLREQVESLSIPDSARAATSSPLSEYEPGTKEYIYYSIAQYNNEAYLEIVDPETRVVVADVDGDEFVELGSMLDEYMESYAPNQPDLKNYVKIVSLYLAFVAKRPLHPPSLMAPKGNRDAATKSGYYCVEGKADLDERFPICRYCVAYSESKSRDR